MGMLRGTTNLSGETVNDVELGIPVIVREDGTPYQVGDSMLDLFFAWDDAGLPTGTIDADGVVTPEEPV